MKILICGGRDYATTDRDQIKHMVAMLDRVAFKYAPFEIMEGGAPGADTMAWTWALIRGVRCDTYPADWAIGRDIRNKHMIDQMPDMVVAFPGGDGTKNCCDQADAAGIRVVRL